MLQERGVQPVHLTVRTVEGPGNQIYGVNSGYASLPRDGRSSTRSGGYGDLDEPSGRERPRPAGGAPARPGDRVPAAAREAGQRSRRRLRPHARQRRGGRERAATPPPTSSS